MTPRKAKRTERRRGRGPVHLGERDLAILLAVGKMKLLRTKDITRLYFGSKATANKRLRRLYDAGFLQCFVSSLACDNIYGLSPKGKAVLGEQMGEQAERLPAPKGLGRTNLHHLFALNEFRISLVLEAHQRPEVELAFFLSEWELKGELGSHLLDLIPDALFGLQAGSSDEVQVTALEVDLGTEHPRYVGKYKVGKYKALVEARLPLFGYMISRVLFVVPRLRRAGQLARVMREWGVGGEFYLGVWGQRAGGWGELRIGSVEGVIRGLREGWGVEEIMKDVVVVGGREGTLTAYPDSEGTLTGAGNNQETIAGQAG